MSNFVQNTEPTSAPSLDLSFRDKKNLAGLYLCVLVKGTLPNGHRGYAYFGVFAQTLLEFMRSNYVGKPFNPKDLKAVVLARSSGEPSPEIREFMRYKFSFAEDQGILEISRSETKS